MAWCEGLEIRTYIPERKQKNRRWTDKPAAHEEAFRANRRRVRGKRGRQLNRWRSERCERTFAHVCETGGGRRTWLRGLENVNKAHTLRCAAFNLGLLMRKVWGLTKPRSGKNGAEALSFELLALLSMAFIQVAVGTDGPDTALWGILALLMLCSLAHTITCRQRGFSEKGLF